MKIERNIFMRKILILVVMVAAFALPTTAQNFEAQQPNAAFQSTSTMMGTGSKYSSNPTISENGTASAPSYAPASGPKKVLPSTPSTKGDQGNVPLGDALIPLSLMALAFCGVVYYRRKKALKS